MSHEEAERFGVLSRVAIGGLWRPRIPAQSSFLRDIESSHPRPDRLAGAAGRRTRGANSPWFSGETVEERNIVVAEERSRFIAAIKSVLRVRDSVAVEMGLLIMAYTVGIWVWRSEVALGSATWYTLPDATQLHLTRAGY